MGDVVAAVFLLAAPVGSPAPVPDADSWPVVRDGLVSVAVAWEVMDEREAKYIPAQKDFQADVDMLRGRVKELADAPPLADWCRLPPRDDLTAGTRFNRAFRNHLRDRAALELDRTAELEAAMAETDALYRVWDAARDAGCPYYYVPHRRRALKAIRDAVGDDAYERGELPPAVPVWRFNELR